MREEPHLLVGISISIQYAVRNHSDLGKWQWQVLLQGPWFSHTWLASGFQYKGLFHSCSSFLKSNQMALGYYFVLVIVFRQCDSWIGLLITFLSWQLSELLLYYEAPRSDPARFLHILWTSTAAAIGFYLQFLRGDQGQWQYPTFLKGGFCRFP